MKKGKMLIICAVSFFAWMSHVDAKNIENAFTYDETSCITGEEPTCQRTTCYGSNTKDSCRVGTIIKYKVNETESKYFHVLHDDGSTLTLQARENLVSNIAWYNDDSVILVPNNKGPLTALTALEEKTSGWTNVNSQTYTMGQTAFLTTPYTGCSVSGNTISCTNNQYTLGSRTAKARMITVEEAAKVGCKPNSVNCPKFMYNYLKEATAIGGTKEATDYRYWTMNARTEDIYQTYAYSIEMGEIGASAVDTDIGSYSSGVRPVIVVNKEEIENSGNDTPADDSSPDNGTSSNSNIQNQNKQPQIVKVENTGINAPAIGFTIGMMILTTGIYIIYHSVHLKENER